MPAHPKPKRKRVKPSGKSSTHLDMIRRLPCLLSGRPAEAAHIRYPDSRHGKQETGIGRKPDDKWTVPLCPELHRLLAGSQHNGSERKWWEQFKIDPLAVAIELYGKPLIHMERVIIRHQPWSPAIKARVLEILRGEK
jgi:hypothetical protein